MRNKHCCITIALNEEEHAKITAEAAAARITLSAYARQKFGLPPRETRKFRDHKMTYQKRREKLERDKAQGIRPHWSGPVYRGEIREEYYE
jgi:hypothetical protein